jgi:NhaA family Na+:H+ antiporter
MLPSLTIGIHYRKPIFEPGSTMEDHHNTSDKSVISPLQRFIHLEYSSSTVLFVSVLAAILWANSAFHESYHHFWELKLTSGFFLFDMPLHQWVNDGLMAVFFFVIGLELKREFMGGELSTVKKASLPVMAALGGMLFPAIIYFLINRGTEAVNGWGIPMATDIAFALALLSLAGKHVPVSLKIFLSALAVADDLGAVMVIAFFYTANLDAIPLLTGILLLLILAGGNKLGIKHWSFYLFIGIGVWAGFLLSGVHATIAGVLVAFTIPNQESATKYTPLQQIENMLHPWVAFFIMPFFALANAGILIGANFFSDLINPVSIGVISGLVAGKFAGVVFFSWLMVRFGFAQLPAMASWGHITGVALLAGVGFTMSLFISNLAFETPGFIGQAKYGILTASVVAGISGLLILKYLKKQ